ncbi:MAG: DUF971 domain-containing protein [Planctomycetota bacterium]
MLEVDATRPREFEILDHGVLLIVWADGHESLYEHRALRLACECARCVDEWTHAPLLEEQRVARDITVGKAEPTGNYGVNLFFSDGHSTGIYTFKRLRALCPCCNESAETS